MSENDPLEIYNQQLAKDIINRMPDDLQRELPPSQKLFKVYMWEQTRMENG